MFYFAFFAAGLQPVENIQADELISQSRLSLKYMIGKEPYLAFSILFLCLRILLMRLPRNLSWLKSFWASYIPHLKLGIFGETSQMLNCAIQMIDVRRFYFKLRHCKTQNFHGGTKNARVWASSLASVSIGESSSARSST